MAITLDTIANKMFSIVTDKGYDMNDVDDFLDEILEEMEAREAEANRLKVQIAQLTQERDQAIAAAQQSASAAPAAVPAVSDRHSGESFELVLTKAKGLYDEILATAESRSDEIIAKANEDAAAIRANAEGQISDLKAKLAQLRTQASECCATLQKAVDGHKATIDQLQKLL